MMKIDLKTLEYSATAIMIIESDTTISFVNKKFTQLIGYSKKELIGKSWTKLIYKEDLKKMLEFHKQRRKRNKKAPTEYEFRYINKKGKVNWAHIKIRIIPGTKKTIASLLDITKRKEAEERLIQLTKMKENFVRNASHELKTPITIMLMDIDLLKQEVSKKEINRKKEKEIIKMLERNTKRLNHLTKNILTFEKIKQGKEKYIKRKINLVKAINEIVKDYATLTKKRRIKIIKTAPSKLIIKADPKIKIAISNLIDNALKFDKKGPIKITLEDRKKGIFFSVKDKGRGFTKKETEKLFTDFYKAHANDKGTGIGLTIAEAIIEKHKGTIWAESKGKNKGACFCFTLPKK